MYKKSEDEDFKDFNQLNKNTSDEFDGFPEVDGFVFIIFSD
jgi:hypothetical protein